VKYHRYVIETNGEPHVDGFVKAKPTSVRGGKKTENTDEEPQQKSKKKKGSSKSVKKSKTASTKVDSEENGLKSNMNESDIDDNDEQEFEFDSTVKGSILPCADEKRRSSRASRAVSYKDISDDAIAAALVEEQQEATTKKKRKMV
jgi:hypothetical protein